MWTIWSWCSLPYMHVWRSEEGHGCLSLLFSASLFDTRSFIGTLSPLFDPGWQVSKFLVSMYLHFPPVLGLKVCVAMPTHDVCIWLSVLLPAEPSFHPNSGPFICCHGVWSSGRNLLSSSVLDTLVQMIFVWDYISNDPRPPFFLSFVTWASPQQGLFQH